jgi:hypothetical protein
MGYKKKTSKKVSRRENETREQYFDVKEKERKNKKKIRIQ